MGQERVRETLKLYSPYSHKRGLMGDFFSIPWMYPWHIALQVSVVCL